MSCKVTGFAATDAETRYSITILFFACIIGQVNHIMRFVFSAVSALAALDAGKRYCVIFLLAYVVAQVNHIRRLMLFAKQTFTLNQSISCVFIATMVIT